jgi:hypothetical protein
MTLLTSKGCEKVKAVKQIRGSTGARSGHFKLPTATQINACLSPRFEETDKQVSLH